MAKYQLTDIQLVTSGDQIIFVAQPTCHKPQSERYRCYCEEKEEESYCNGCEFWYALGEKIERSE